MKYNKYSIFQEKGNSKKNDFHDYISVLLWLEFKHGSTVTLSAFKRHNVYSIILNLDFLFQIISRLFDIFNLCKMSQIIEIKTYVIYSFLIFFISLKLYEFHLNLTFMYLQFYL